MVCRGAGGTGVGGSLDLDVEAVRGCEEDESVAMERNVQQET